jgi:hypothetical protein
MIQGYYEMSTRTNTPTPQFTNNMFSGEYPQQFRVR